MENRPKMRKGPSFPGLGRGISLVCPCDIGTPSLHLSDAQFAVLIPNILNKIEETVLLDEFYTVPCTFRLSLPKVMG